MRNRLKGVGRFGLASLRIPTKMIGKMRNEAMREAMGLASGRRVRDQNWMESIHPG